MMRTFTMLARSLFALALLVNASGSSSETLPSSDGKKRLERFEKEVDDLRNRLKIPGLSAVIVKDQKVLWAKGFGFADLVRLRAKFPNSAREVDRAAQGEGARRRACGPRHPRSLRLEIVEGDETFHSKRIK